MAIHCGAAAEHDGLIKKKEKEKKSSWVKLIRPSRLTSGGLISEYAVPTVKRCQIRSIFVGGDGVRP